MYTRGYQELFPQNSCFLRKRKRIFLNVFHCYDLNKVYHKKADVQSITKMLYFLSFEGLKPELLAVKVG